MTKTFTRNSPLPYSHLNDGLQKLKLRFKTIIDVNALRFFLCYRNTIWHFFTCLSFSSKLFIPFPARVVFRFSTFCFCCHSYSIYLMKGRKKKRRPILLDYFFSLSLIFLFKSDSYRMLSICRHCMNVFGDAVCRF